MRTNRGRRFSGLPLRPSSPETAAGGFSKVDGTVEFYSRVQAVLPSEGVVVDLGAGRGRSQEDPVEWRRRLCDLRGEHRVVVGVDVDRAVKDNTIIDAAVLVSISGGLPFADGCLSLVVADWVFEHLQEPAVTASELARTVVPGGWLCARTPNKWGYVALGAQAVPRARHSAVLRRLQPFRAEKDMFPTFYGLNTRGAIRHAFPPHLWLDCTYPYNPDPSYVGRSMAADQALRAWQRISPPSMATTLHIFLQRRQAVVPDAGT